MTSEIQIHLFGSLRRARKSFLETVFRMPLDTPAPLTEILAREGIPEDRVQLVMVNHRAVPKNTRIRPGDRVALFPPEYAIFADWKDLRG